VFIEGHLTVDFFVWDLYVLFFAENQQDGLKAKKITRLRNKIANAKRVGLVNEAFSLDLELERKKAERRNRLSFVPLLSSISVSLFHFLKGGTIKLKNAFI